MRRRITAPYVIRKDRRLDGRTSWTVFIRHRDAPPGAYLGVCTFSSWQAALDAVCYPTPG